MGIRFSTNTWRAPLQLIDCWLPVEPPHTAQKPLALPRALQNFVRAGWIQRPTPAPCPNHGPTIHGHGASRPSVARHHAETPQALGRPTKALTQNGARLVISGRMGDVCAELERLTALELRTAR